MESRKEFVRRILRSLIKLRAVRSLLNSKESEFCKEFVRSLRS